MVVEPFEESRRLTGCNACFAGTGAALESAPGVVFDDGTLTRWTSNVAAAREALGWPDGDVFVRRHRSGVSLAFAAPMDQLYVATEANEWAWYDALGQRAPAGPLDADGLPLPPHPASLPRAAALAMLRQRAQDEAKPALPALAQAASEHGLPLLADDDAVTLGAGAGSHTWPIDALPTPADVEWAGLHAIPVALVTGSNGKTTSVRLLAAMARAHGWHTAYSSTDGVQLDDALLEAGDFSGPAGARAALRCAGAQAAILETARGGLLRRGLALCRADVALVTNIAADHFGEYGVHDLDDLAMVKLAVARAVSWGGLLALNADDEVLRRHAARFEGPRLGWFALDDADPVLEAHRVQGGATCGVADGRLRLHVAGRSHDLGVVADMPLTLGGRARYNVSNLAGAALAAQALGVGIDAIAGVLHGFGAGRDDNPGRLQRWQVGGVDVVVDYAHNPDGLRGLLQAVEAGAGGRRFAVVVGHAGNREDDDLRAVAATAAAFAPALVVLKSAEGYLRGRAPEDIPAIMREELLRLGMDPGDVVVELDEAQAARRALAWARPGDLVVLPTFDRDARERIATLLERMELGAWRAGDPLPEAPPPIEEEPRS